MTARRAVAAIRADWDMPGPGPADLAGYLRAHPVAGHGWQRAVRSETGDADAALAAAATQVKATYTTAYLAHVPLETRAALAEWDDGRLTVWTGTNVPFAVRARLSQTFGISEAAIRVIVPPVGGGFGGKHGAEAVEAARLARGTGRPVKVRWNRAEEFQRGYLRPMAVIDVRAGLDAAGSITAWDFLDINAGASGFAFPYAVPNRRLRYQPAVSPHAQGPYRALSATANTFARESHIDELAYVAHADPLRFRLRHLDDERLAAVLKAAVGRFGWQPGWHRAGRPAWRDGFWTRRGAGVAVGLEKGGRVATCAEVSADGAGHVGVTRIGRVAPAHCCGRGPLRTTACGFHRTGLKQALPARPARSSSIPQGRPLVRSPPKRRLTCPRVLTLSRRRPWGSPDHVSTLSGPGMCPYPASCPGRLAEGQP